jgi:hypothetical protein
MVKNENKESIKNQNEYRSFVGRLFYDLKTDTYSLDAVRELSAHLFRPTEVHWNFLLEAGYLKGCYISLKYVCQKLQVTSSIDFDYASDNVNLFHDTSKQMKVLQFVVMKPKGLNCFQSLG